MPTLDGFTLIEVLVVIAIISVVSALLLASQPAIRAQQSLTLTTTLISSQLHTAEQESLNQSQPASVGVAIKGSQLVRFADTFGENKKYDEGSDVVLEQQFFPGGTSTTAGDWQSWMFVSVPPNMEFFRPDGHALDGTQDSQITLVLGSLKRVLSIKAYGQVTIAP